jgi:hypothetical protein
VARIIVALESVATSIMVAPNSKENQCFHARTLRVLNEFVGAVARLCEGPRPHLDWSGRSLTGRNDTTR